MFGFFKNRKATRRKKIAFKRFLQTAGATNLEKSWNSHPEIADQFMSRELRTVVARSREQALNNGNAKKYCLFLKDNIAGSQGFRLVCECKDRDGTLDEYANKAIENAYKDFSRKENFLVTGTHTRRQLERQISSTFATDGEVIVRKRYNKKYKYGIKFELLDPLFLDPNCNEDLRNGNHVRLGIEINSDGQPLAYHFSQKVDRIGASPYDANRRTRIPADEIIHSFCPELINQRRGLPKLLPALWRMRMLAGYEDSAVTNARIGASKMAMFRDPQAESEDNEDLAIDSFTPGELLDIGTRELQEYNPAYPNGEFDAFTKASMRSLAAGLGISYASLSGDLTEVNYSSIRQGSLEEREHFSGLQEDLIDDLIRPIYECWLEMALLKESILINGKTLKILKLDKYKEAKFIGRRWKSIDPQKDMSAQQIAINMGIKSRAQVIRENGGQEPEDVWREIKKESEDLIDILPNSKSAVAGETKYVVNSNKNE